MVVVLYFCFNFDGVVRGGEPYFGMFVLKSILSDIIIDTPALL